MQNKEIKFGTDGWRGIISDNFTFANVRRVARAIAVYYNRLSGGKTSIAVGYDTRFLSGSYAAAAADVLSENGVRVVISDRAVPTPTLSYAVKKRGLTAGVMITASHNPAAYNGIKIKTAAGGAAGVEVTSEVEKILEEPECGCGGARGKIEETDFTADYVSFLRRYVDLKLLRKKKFRVLMDPMHGSGNGFIAEVLKGTQVKLDFLRREVNPSFGGLRPEPVLENLLGTQKYIKQGKFDLGLVLDGDADRIAAFAGSGEFIIPQKVLGLLVLHLIQDRGMSGGVVKTIVGTNLMDNICSALGLKLYETPVGFKYISELMLKEDILVGGEEAGGMGFKNYVPERDGTLAGLLLLEMMAFRKKNMLSILQDMERKYGRYYYLRDDMKLDAGLNADVTRFKSTGSLLGKKVVGTKDYDGLKLICEDGSWLMFRGSGTEPIMRIYSEAGSLKRSRELLLQGRKMILSK